MKTSLQSLRALVLIFIFVFTHLSGQIVQKENYLVKKPTTPQKIQLNDKVGLRFSKEKEDANQYKLQKDDNEVISNNISVFQSINSNSKNSDSGIKLIGSKNTDRSTQKSNTSKLTNSTLENTSSANNISSPLEAMKGKSEVMEKRDAYSKHFKNADGSYTAIIDAVPMHYKKNGKFLDIVFNVVPNASVKYPFANTTNLFESYFGSTSKDGIKIKTAEGEVQEFLNTRMYWEVKGQEVGALQSSNAKIKVKGDKAYYNDLYGNISAEFTMLTGRRKLDYFIPNKKSLGNIPINADFLVFTEDVIMPEGWTHSITEKGIAILDKNNKQIYLYESPRSSDALNEFSREKNTVYETILNGTILTIRTKVKKAWLLSNDRKFPVKVDPTANAIRSYMISVYDDGDEIAGPYFYGRDAGYFLNTFVKYDTSAIPTGSTVTAATSLINITARAGTVNAANGVLMANSADPTTIGGVALYNSATTSLTGTITTNTTGVKTMTFTAGGRTYIQNALGSSVNLAIYGAGAYNVTNYFTLGTGMSYPRLNITYTAPPACSGTPTGGTTVLTPNTGTYGSTFIASVTGSTVATGLSYQWQSAPSASGPWTDIPGATAPSVNLTAPNVLTTLYARRKITCGSNSSYSSAVPYTITCTPSHTSGNCFAPGDCGYVWISNVNIGTINNTTLFNTAPPSYNNYTALSTDISQNNTYPLNITYRDIAGNLGNIGAWIDWNNDGDFEDANEFIGVAVGVPSNSIVGADVVVPIGVAPGTKKLRIRSVFAGETLTSNDACTIKQYGETEDYSVRVVTATDCVPTSWQPDGLYINSVAFVGTLADPPVNTSTFNNAAPLGYQNFTTLPVKAVQAQGEGINIIAAATGPLGRGTWKAWVDWNKNGFFEPATEEVYNIQGFAGPEVTFGFVIPLATTPGDYKIRIRVNNGIDYTDYPPDAYETFGFDFSPCDPFTEYASYNNNIDDFGETEDYLFTVEAKCNSVITSITNGQNCGPGTVILGAAATAGVTEFRWYTTKTGGSLLGTSAPTGTSTTFTTPSISATKKYYVTAWNGSCESQERTLVTAKINLTPVVTFLQTAPNVCGESTIMQLTAIGDKEVVHLINEDFESGSTLGVFENINDPAVDANNPAVKANTSWKNQTSTFVPSANIWFPAISSGFGPNKFALAYSDSKNPDYPTAIVENSIALTTAVNSNLFLNLTLNLKLYYSRYISDTVIDPAADEYVNIELSTDGGATYPIIIESFTSDVEIGTRFAELSYDLSDYIDQPNLKIRVRHRSWAGNDGWLPDGVAIDNVELYGEKPLITSFEYDTATIDAFTDIACAPGDEYTSGTPITTIFLKPSATQLEDNATFTVPVSATLSNGCSASGSLSITNNTKVWNNGTTNWSTNNWKPLVSGLGTVPPSSSNCVIIKQPVILGVGATGAAQNIKVEGFGELTVNGDLTVTDFIKNETIPLLSNEDNLVLASDANLIQINSGAANTGRMTAQRYVSNMDYNPGSAVDYVYWSSPVLGQKTKNTVGFLDGFSPGTANTNFFYYNESNDRFYETGDPTFRLGRGYAVQAERDRGTSYNKTYEFKGTPNNGDIGFGLAFTNATHGYNLVGNPYPSNIKFDELYKGNCDVLGSNCLIWNTAYFWTNNVYQQYQMGQSYGGNNYAIYNGTGGNSATKAAGGIGNNVVPDGYVKVGQGFIVQAQKAGTLNFKHRYYSNPDLRVANPGTFFQKDAPQKNRYWLSLLAPSNLINSQLIGYVQGGTDGFEQDYDAEAFDNYSDLFYSVIPAKKLLIQGKSAAFTDEDKVTLGANFFQNGLYTIALENAEGIFNGSQNIYLRDKQEGIITNLSQGSYTFTASAGDNATRFEIIYKPETILATGDGIKDDLVVYRNGNDFVVKSQSKKIDAIDLYDTAGRLIYTALPKNKEALIPAEKLINSVYVLKISRGGEISTKKIVR